MSGGQVVAFQHARACAYRQGAVEKGFGQYLPARLAAGPGVILLDEDIVLESFQEHHVADVIVNELQNLDVSDEKWGAKFKVLKENIEHHIQDEEGPMWRSARAVFSQDELRQLGARMARMKAEAQAGR